MTDLERLAESLDRIVELYVRVVDGAEDVTDSLGLRSADWQSVLDRLDLHDITHAGAVLASIRDRIDEALGNA